MSLILYTLPLCVNCNTLKEKLRIMGYEYEEKDMSTAESLTDLKLMGCFAQEAPVLCLDEVCYEYHHCMKEGFFADLMGVCNTHVEVADIQETHGKLST
jgi:glutaredoxin